MVSIADTPDEATDNKKQANKNTDTHTPITGNARKNTSFLSIIEHICKKISYEKTNFE
jgi:hypothetical protein